MRAPFLLVLPLLAGCAAVGPDYHAPDIATPPAFSTDDAPFSVPVAAQADLTRWWTQFHDAELDSLIARALDANLDLKAAASRVRQAREQEIIAGAAALPSVSASGDAMRLHSGRNIFSQLGGGSSSSGGAPASGGTDATLYSLGFDATWEIDVFGGVRRGVEAARAGSEAARWQMRDGEVTLTAEIAADYFALRAAQARLALLADEMKGQGAMLDLVAARARGGFVTQLDVNQQDALRATTEAEVPTLQAQARTLEHAIAVLLAMPPEALAGELDPVAALPEAPASLPIGLPSDLLRRRPDVRAAERSLAQATAEQGVAIAALYPTFNLIGALNLAGNSPGALFNSDSLNEVGLGMISWPLFKGGQAQANIRAKAELRDQAYLAYRKAVLGAVRDADDALVRYAAEQRRFLALQQAVTRDASSAVIAGQQYRAGLTNYVNVLTAQNNDLQARDALLQSRQALIDDLASLYKALGGGWRTEEGADAPVSP